ncbi:hypothetical protein TrLO_g16007 [Triparma laevis f. longispina]|uniref:Uncharacterized protein n=1 Tax=Triparma laevis f. longispina TaxID=1714387 RepID=A0A9W7E5T2_9STRA|nr:hypothetical protein TrLO_g16007 [Triparma laevis f. longispina]
MMAAVKAADPNALLIAIASFNLHLYHCATPKTEGRPGVAHKTVLCAKILIEAGCVHQANEDGGTPFGNAVDAANIPLIDYYTELAYEKLAPPYLVDMNENHYDEPPEFMAKGLVSA